MNIEVKRYYEVCAGQSVIKGSPGEIPWRGTINVAIASPPIIQETGLLVMVHGMGSDWDEHDQCACEWAEKYNLVCIQVQDRHAGKRGVELYYDFGKYQTIDLLRATLWARDFFKTNPDRTCVWGGSGGGHIVLQLMLYAPHLFAFGIANAAITHPTLPGELERREWQDGWMRRCIPEGPIPDDEQAVRSPLMMAENLRGKLLLMHGTEDDVVSPEHSERLAKRLHELGKAFRYEPVYGGIHNFSGGPVGMESRKRATETIASEMLLNEKRNWKEPNLPFEIQLTHGWYVNYPVDRLPSLLRKTNNSH